MRQKRNLLTVPHLPIADVVNGFTRKQVLEILDMGESTLREYQKALCQDPPMGWFYEPKPTGSIPFLYSDLEVLWHLKWLVSFRGRTWAIKNIHKYMEVYYGERIRERIKREAENPVYGKQSTTKPRKVELVH